MGKDPIMMVIAIMGNAWSIDVEMGEQLGGFWGGGGEPLLGSGLGQVTRLPLWQVVVSLFVQDSAGIAV